MRTTPIATTPTVESLLGRRRRSTPTFTTLDEAPVILTIEEVAGIYRCGVRTIKRQIATGEFQPAPFTKFPYRWRKADVAQDLATREAFYAAEARARIRRRAKRKRSS